MQVSKIENGAYRENAWLAVDGGEAALVDPGSDPERLLAAVAGAGARLCAVLLTHGHLDHLSALPGIAAAAPGASPAAPVPVRIAAADAAWCFTAANDLPPYVPVHSPPAGFRADLSEGAEIRVGGETLRVLATPGHSPGGVCFFADAAPDRPPLLFSGDTLFAGSAGRTDFPGGDDAEMAASLRRLAALPPETLVLPGHGPATTIGRELRCNPFVREALR